MTTYNKDFVIKNGLIVNDGATFGDSVTINGSTVATQSYVQSAIASSGGGGGTGLIIDATEPSTPINGMLWLDTNIQRIKVYYGEAWLVLATSTDAEYLPEHKHNTSIDGDGYITEIVAGDSDPNIVYLDGGTPSTTTFSTVLNGGGV